MIMFISIGSYGLSFLVQGKKELEDLAKGRRSLTTREYDLEEDYKKTMKKLNPDAGYEIKRIPRPDEEEAN